jgi:DNA-binding LacI/PurR family transcriptional regulator
METRDLLEAIVIDRSHSVPLHHQLFLEMRRLILQEKLKPGTGLPQVGEICRSLGFSTITATRAIAELKREGLVVTRRGVGIFVAEQPAPVTEVVVGFAGASAATPGDFLFPLVEGIKSEFADSRRRCVLTYFDEQAPSVDEIRDLMRSRRADSLIAFRPKPTVIQAARLLSHDFPAVIVFGRPPGWPGDSVLAMPEKALRRLLEARLKAGRRRFVYLGKTELRERQDDQSPYQRLEAVFREVMGEAGILPETQVLKGLQGSKAEVAAAAEAARFLAGWVGGLPPGTVLVADTPHVAAQALALNPGLDPVAYTEVMLSVEQFKDRITLLYCELDKAGALAVRLLRERLANPQLPPRTEEMDAQIVQRSS